MVMMNLLVLLGVFRVGLLIGVGGIEDDIVDVGVG